MLAQIWCELNSITNQTAPSINSNEYGSTVVVDNINQKQQLNSKFLQSSSSISIEPKIIQSNYNNKNDDLHLVDQHQQQHIVANNPATSLDESSSKIISSIINNNNATLESLNYSWYQTIQNEVMERIRNLQREYHKSSLVHLLNHHNNHLSESATNKLENGLTTTTNLRDRKSSSSPSQHEHSLKSQNFYDTVADALQDDQDSSLPPLPSSTPPYHRPFDHEMFNSSGHPQASSSSTNLDSQRQEIDQWLVSMEKRFGDFVQEYNQAYLQQRRKNSAGGSTRNNITNSGPTITPVLDSLTSEASLKKQLAIISVSFF